VSNWNKSKIIFHFVLDRDKILCYYVPIRNSKEVNVPVDNNFRRLRIESGFATQEQAAKALGISRSAIAKWELGQQLPGIKKLKEVARVYKCSVDNLLPEPSKEVSDMKTNPNSA
jgi:DNA-binding XRE family transcriptional regulator